MDTLAELIQSHGPAVYVGLFLYCIYKAGLPAFFAGIAVSQGLLDIKWVVLAVLSGTLLADELRFALSRHYGVAWSQPYPRIHRLLNAATERLERFGGLYLLMYRFVFGLRSVGALPVGLTDMRSGQFRVLNLAGGLLWTQAMVGGGILLGRAAAQGAPHAYAALGVVMALLLLALMRRTPQNS